MRHDHDLYCSNTCLLIVSRITNAAGIIMMLRIREVTMQVNGIIAEYNPFHNGHKYQMEEARRRTSANYTIVAMSGNFVQRGAPALLGKHSRAEMALR